MISLAKLVRQILSEELSFRELWDATNSKDGGARQTRSHHVRVRDMAGLSTADGEGWIFSYGELEDEIDVNGVPTGRKIRRKVTVANARDNVIAKKFKSEPAWNTTGKSWAGYVRLFKDQKANDPKSVIQDLNCEVDCSCPDYKYKWAYHNAQAGAGKVGAGSWSGNSGAVPQKYTQGKGICKHLMALVEYLGTSIAPVAPKPEDKPPYIPPSKKPVQPPTAPVPLAPQPAQKPQLSKPPTPPVQPKAPVKTTLNAPKPEDDEYPNTYPDTGGLVETEVDPNAPKTIAQILDAFVTENPEFKFKVDDDTQ
jgi:hypothetical protein